MNITKVKTVTSELQKFGCFDKDAYITVTEWENGEGYNININNKNFDLHIDELSAINYLTQVLMYEK